MPTLRDVVFSLKTFAAAMLALYVAFSLDLPRPYWAMLTVYIVAQPLSGMARSKGVYRAAGTLAGAAFAVVAVPNLVTAPELLSLALAGWLALCLYASLLDGTPRAYAYMLAGYTAAIIGFPSVAAPESIFDTALARSEEILLGILCATLVDMLVLPRPVGPIFRTRLDAWLEDAARWTRDVLAGETEARAEADRHRLVADAAALGTLRLHAAYDTPALRAAEGWLVQLERRMRMLVSVLLAVEDRLAVLRRSDPAALERLRPALDRLATAVSTSGKQADAQLSARDLRTFRPPRESMARDWDALMQASLLARLHDLATLWRECRELRRKITAGERTRSRDDPPAPHRDRAMAALSAAAAAVATLLACAFWIGSAWPEGGTAATMAAVLSCLFAATDDPAPFALTFLWCTVASATVAGIYLLGVLPVTDGFPLLAAALACFFVPVAALLPVPALFPYAMPLVVNTAAFMAIQGAYGVDITSYLNGAVAQIVGMSLAVVVLRLVRSVGATVAARRLAAATQADLVRLAAGDEALGRARFEARVLDRVGALLPRLREADPDQRRRLLDGSLLDLRIGLNLLHLHERLRRRPDAASGSLSTLLRDLAAFFRRRDPVDRALPPALLARLDDALAGVGDAKPSVSNTATLLALAGMRRALFPDADRPNVPGGAVVPPAVRLEPAA